MATRVIMPKLGLTMTEGKIGKWLMADGQPVRQGEILYEFETDKAAMEVEAPAEGVIRITAGAGTAVPVGETVGWIVAPGEPLPGDSLQPSAEAAVPLAAGQPRAASIADAGREREGRIKASPVARKLAEEAGLDLATIEGTGPGGRITKEDVEAALARLREAPPAVPSPMPAPKPESAPAVAVPQSAPTQPVPTMPLPGAQGTIAERLLAGHQTAARVTLFAEVDAGELVALSGKLGSEGASYSDALLLIVARALRAFPYVNARLNGKAIEQLAEVHLGLALETPDGLAIPVICDADRKGLRQLAQERRDLLARAGAGRLTPDEAGGGAFTLVDLGEYDVDALTPLINLSETAALGVGRVVERPAVHGGQIAVRPMLRLSLSFDHRLVDGAPAARFLQQVARLIEQPTLILA